MGNSGYYTYRVPQIEADTQGAEAINKAISDEYSPIVNGVLENVSDKVSLSCFYVAWEKYQYENILSLVVSCGWDADVNEYNVYLYDIASGQQLTTADLLKVMNVDEAAFLEAARRAAAATFDTQWGTIAGGDMDEFLTERRDWTLSDETSTWTSAHTLTVPESSMLFCLSALSPARTLMSRCWRWMASANKRGSLDT